MTNNSPKNVIRIFVEQFGLCSLFENATFVTVNSENVFRVFGTSEFKKWQNLFSNNYSFYSLRALSGNKSNVKYAYSFTFTILMIFNHSGFLLYKNVINWREIPIICQEFMNEKSYCMPAWAVFFLAEIIPLNYFEVR